jgi:hypothetical protein
MNEYSHLKRALLGLLLTLGCCMPLRAQQESPSSQDDQNPQAQTSSKALAESSSLQRVDSAAGLPQGIEVRPAGSSSPLLSYDSFLRWGPIYVRSIEFFQSYDQIEGVGGGGQGIFNQLHFASSIFRTDLVYDRQLNQSRLELEYSPRVTAVNGKVSGEFTNQTANLNWIDQLSPRWTLGVKDSLSYLSARQLFGDYFLSVDAVTGTSLPSSLLDGGGSWLITTTEVTVAYALSPTSSVAVVPFFGYGHVSGPINSAQPFSIYQYGGEVGWKKQLSPSQAMRVNYYSRVVGDFANGVLYQSGDVGYFRQFGPSTVLGISAGVLTAGFAQKRQWEFSGSAQLSRKFGRSTAEVGYYRGVPLVNETATQGVAQRIDGSYRLDFSRRWYSQVRGGYEDSLWSVGANVTGKYIAGEAGYNLTPQWSCFVSYAHKIQSGTDPFLLTGTRNYYLAGIRWSARPIQ